MCARAAARPDPRAMPAKPSTPPKTRSQKARQAKPTVRFRLRITVGDVVAIGPGKIALVEAIAATGSITAAAKSLDMSYRRAWMLLNELNRSLRRPAVDSPQGGAHGGGSEVTEAGRELIDLYRRIEATAASAGQADIARLLGLMAR